MAMWLPYEVTVCCSSLINELIKGMLWKAMAEHAGTLTGYSYWCVAIPSKSELGFKVRLHQYPTFFLLEPRETFQVQCGWFKPEPILIHGVNLATVPPSKTTDPPTYSLVIVKQQSHDLRNGEQ